MTPKYILLPLLIIVFLSACSDDTPVKEIETPVSYEFTRDAISTVSFSGQTTRIEMATELINGMKDFDKTAESLIEMYANETASGADANPYEDADLNASTKSVRSKIAASKDFFSTNSVEAAEIKNDFETWITAQVDEVYTNKNVLAEVGVAGQIADGSSVRFVNAKGLEYNQAVNKSMIGALMVDQMLNNYLSSSVLDDASNVSDNDNDILADGEVYTNMEHKWDEAYGYLFGAKDANHADPMETLGSGSFLNKYLSRVNDDSDFDGLAQDIYDALKLGRAAIVAKDYEVRDAQANIIREKLSQVIAVRAVYYLQQGKIAKEQNDLGGAFHDLSEGFGFVYSLRFLRVPETDNAYFSKTEVDGFISLLTAGNGFWDIDSATLDQISEDIAGKFDFTVAQAGS